MKKALVLTSNFPRWTGDSTPPFVLHLAQDLAERGWTADVLAPHAPGAATHEVLGDIDVRRFRYAYPETAQTVCYGGGALVNLRKRRSNYLKVPVLLGAEWSASLRRLRAGRYDLVHAHWVLPQGFVAAAVPSRTPVVVTVHGGAVFGLQSGVLARAKAWTLRTADAVTVNSSATESAARDLVGSRARIERIPMGAHVAPTSDATAAELRKQFDAGGPVVVFVGRLIEDKGVGDLIQATRHLRDRLPGLRVVIVGDGQDRARFERDAADLGDTVTFTGWLDPDDVGAHLAMADLFVAPSRTGVDGWVEGQGLTIIEAMLAGTPVVATRSGGIVDSITDGETGRLVAEASPQDLADAIVELAEDSDLARELSKQARIDAERRFTRSASARAFAGLFDEVVATSRARREV